ncbi:MAG: oligosaccharide flippase family protein, partial [Flavobacteriales bacterium]|nr:oligosaccharide flippase family protein [Flavobacteriales bacterium]
MIRKVFTQSLLYFVASYTPMLANLFLLPIINQYLNPEDYAIFGLTFSYIGLLQGFSDLGLIQQFQDTFFKEPDQYKAHWGRFLGFLRVYRPIYALAVAALLFILFRNHIAASEMAWYLILVTVPVAFFDSTKGIAMRHCQFRQDHRRVYIGTLLSGIITVTLTYFLIVHGGFTYMAWFISAFVARLAEFIYYGYYLQFVAGIRASRHWTWPDMKVRIRQSLPLVPKKYANYLVSTSDRAVLDFYRGRYNYPSMGDIGLYNVAYNFANYFGNFQGAVTTVMSPILYKLF